MSTATTTQTTTVQKACIRCETNEWAMIPAPSGRALRCRKCGMKKLESDLKRLAAGERFDDEPADDIFARIDRNHRARASWTS